MPLTKKGKKILKNMKKYYTEKYGKEKGEKKAKEVFYASVNAGKIKGVHLTKENKNNINNFLLLHSLLGDKKLFYTGKKFFFPYPLLTKKQKEKLKYLRNLSYEEFMKLIETDPELKWLNEKMKTEEELEKEEEEILKKLRKK